jgi:hypothetical protein
MKMKIPSKEIIVCDCCQRDTAGVFAKCVVCGKEYCWACRAIFCGCVHPPDVCRDCNGNDKVKAVVERFSKPFSELVKKRDRSLKTCYKKFPIDMQKKM